MSYVNSRTSIKFMLHFKFTAKEAQQFGTPENVPVQRLWVGQLDRTQRGGGRGKRSS